MAMHCVRLISSAISDLNIRLIEMIGFTNISYNKFIYLEDIVLSYQHMFFLSDCNQLLIVI